MCTISVNSQNHSCNHCANIRFINICTHTSCITNTITNVICNYCRVTWIIFRNTCFNFTNKISTNVC